MRYEHTVNEKERLAYKKKKTIIKCERCKEHIISVYKNCVMLSFEDA